MFGVRSSLFRSLLLNLFSSFLNRALRAAAFCGLFCLSAVHAFAQSATISPGWGIDACLSIFVPQDEIASYLRSLNASGVRILRERNFGEPNPAARDKSQADIPEVYRKISDSSFSIVSFAALSNAAKPAQIGNQLPEDLLLVYAEGQRLAQTSAGLVTAFEMVGEPDVGYCTDLPDRVAAYQKALYLGLKAGAENRASIQDSRSKIQDQSAASQQVPGSKLREKSSPASAGPDPHVTAPAGSNQVLNLPSSFLNRQSAPLVLMGALALPPGPWLERAARNGLLDYTDAYNFHFYGWADDLTGVIRAHRAFVQKVYGSQFTVNGSNSEGVSSFNAQPSTFNPRAAARAARSERGAALKPASSDHLESSFLNFESRAPVDWLEVGARLPLWITECGINAVRTDDFLNPERRQIQADFTVATARQALAAKDVSVFMPFILVHKGDPHALTLDVDHPLPAWDAYARFTREHPWPARTLARPVQDPNPIVVQWMPDNSTTLTHKVSGAYRFVPGRSIVGALRLYNFSEHPVRGHLELGGLRHVNVSVELSGEINLPPHGMIPVPIYFLPKEASGYFKDVLDAAWVDETGRRSPVSFGLERWPMESEFVSEPLPLGPLVHDYVHDPEFAHNQYGVRVGPWTTANGIVAALSEAQGVTSPGKNIKAAPSAHLPSGKSDTGERSQEKSSAQNLPSTGASSASPQGPALESSFLNLESSGSTSARGFRFWSESADADPLVIPVASAALNGLPPHGFIRLQLDRPMSREVRVRADLIDDQGQRFTIWENCGASYFQPADDVWLNLEDFHIYFWGRCTEDPRFHPERIREIQLRFYFAKTNDPVKVRLSFMRQK